MAVDAGIYLIKSGQAVDEPGQMLLIKNDPNYNEQWPRALVPYKRIHGVDEPARLPTLNNDGKAHKQLPEGTPFGLVGTSSMYKRESYPGGVIPSGKVTAGPEESSHDPFQGLGTLSYNPSAVNWFVQGADAGRYSNSDVHAVRILVTEPTTDPRNTAHYNRRFWNVANERLRILGEFPVRKFGKDGKQPLDPDGNPDTSFLAKIPGNLAWTFQTLDKNGMVLNMAQTWHQVVPGEVRTDCGGCHAHSQKPTDFKLTLAAKPDYPVWDLTRKTPLLTTKKNDQSGKQWDPENSTGVRWAEGVLNVEYFRDVKPILDRSCIACHTGKSAKPAGNLVLDDDTPMQPQGSLGGMVNGPPEKVPGTFLRLVLDATGRFGHHPRPTRWSHPQNSRYIRLFQSRRSLLAWKIFGKRLDGWKNEDFVTESVPGDPNSLVYQGKPYTPNERIHHPLINLAYTGSIMPPPEAVAGTYEARRQEDQGRAPERRGSADTGPLDRSRLPDRLVVRSREAASGRGQRLDLARQSADLGPDSPTSRRQSGPVPAPDRHERLLYRAGHEQLARDGRLRRGRHGGRRQPGREVQAGGTGHLGVEAGHADHRVETWRADRLRQEPPG